MKTSKLNAIACLAFCIFGFTKNAHADLATGITAYRQNNFTEALQELKPEADNGNAVAQLYLGRAYEDIKEGPQDALAAFKWYQMAAHQGNAIAQEIVGQAYLNGRGVSKDNQAALKWFRLSAEQRNALALDSLGQAYQNGTGVKADKILAMALYNLANFNNDFSLNRGISPGFILAKSLKENEVKSSWNLFCVLGNAKSLIGALDDYVENPTNTPANACVSNHAQ
jgi:TPR repeat protein